MTEERYRLAASASEVKAELSVKYSPLFDLLEGMRLYLDGDIDRPSLLDVIARTRGETGEMRGCLSATDARDADLVAVLDVIEEKLVALDRELQGHAPLETLQPFLEECLALNGSALELLQGMHIVSSQPADGDELLRTLAAGIEEKEYFTPGYMAVMHATLDFQQKKTSEADYVARLAAMKERIRQAKEQYEALYLTPEEWTVEVALGDRLLTEGFVEIERALDYLMENARWVRRDQRYMDGGLWQFFEANRKFVLSEHLSRFVGRQAVLRKKTGR